jgi:hypothetical protein
MARDLRGIFARCLRPARGLRVGCVLLCLAAAATAANRVELYQAMVPSAERCDATQPGTFQAALRIVLIRVTGRRTADEDPALAPLIGNAGHYVQECRRTADNQLWVSFDGAAIDRWLTQNDQPLWGRERPTTFVWLAVPTGPQSGTVLAAEDTSDLKSAIDAAASLRGAPVIWPSAADLQRNHVDYASLATMAPGELADLGHKLGGEGILVGRASNATAAAAVRWTYVFQDHSSEFSGAAAEGVNRAADTYAGIFAVSGSLAPVEIEVTGVVDLRDYALVQSFLESLTFIAHVGVDALSGDAVRFRLTTRGGAEPLLHALSLSGRLQPIAAGDNGMQRFQLMH